MWVLDVSGPGVTSAVARADSVRPSLAIRPCAPLEPFKLAEHYEIPAQLSQYLRPYQREGAQFLMTQYCRNQGALLADDMGLGKTIQVIAFLSALFGKRGVSSDLIVRPTRPVLIVCPAGLVYNWAKECETWGFFRTAICHGTVREEAFEAMREGSVELVFTSYDMVRRHEELVRHPWQVVLCDEVHKLRSARSQVTAAMKSFKTVRRIGLSGTVMQNHFTEFWCVLDWIAPGHVGSQAQFNRNFSKLIMEGQRNDASKEEVLQKDAVIRTLQRKIAPFYLRRTKDVIKDQLPKKEDNVIFCPLTQLQREVYQALLASESFQLIIRNREACMCGTGLPRGKCCFQFTGRHLDPCVCTPDSKRGCQPWHHNVLSCLTLLQQTANHLGLLLPRYQALLRAVRLPPALRDSDESCFLALSSSESCGKMKVLRKLMAVWREEGAKVLLFSSSKVLLDIVEKSIVAEGQLYLRLDGSTSSANRLALVDEFNSSTDINLFLISTTAGGVGLNLTSANVVVVFDPNWNPAHDLQAEDRAFRIGQTRNVRVFRLIAAGCIEEIVYARQIYKQQLSNMTQEGTVKEPRYFSGVQGNSNKEGELFGISNLFALNFDKNLTEDIVSRQEVAGQDYAVGQYQLSFEHPPSRPSATPKTPPKEAVAEEDDLDIVETAAVTEPNDSDVYSLTTVAAELVVGFTPSLPSQELLPPESVLAALQECGVQYMHVHEDVVGARSPKKTVAKRRQSLSRRLSTKAPRRDDAAEAPDDALQGVLDDCPDLDAGRGRAVAAAVAVSPQGEEHFGVLAQRLGHRDKLKFGRFVLQQSRAELSRLISEFYDQQASPKSNPKSRD